MPWNLKCVSPYISGFRTLYLARKMVIAGCSLESIFENQTVFARVGSQGVILWYKSKYLEYFDGVIIGIG